MRIPFKTIILITGILLSSCSSLKVNSETNANADLKKYNFYTLADREDGFLPNVNPTQKMQLEQAIEKEAQALSTVSNNSGVTGPDVLVSYFVIIDTKQDFEVYTNYYGKRRWKYQITDVETREYTEGTLMLDFIDAKTREVVWHGSTTSTITSNSIKLEEKINKAVEILFDQYRKDQSL